MCRDVAHHLSFYQHALQQTKSVTAPHCLSAMLIQCWTKKETKGEREREIGWKEELTCLTCQVHILLKIRLIEGGRVGREERQ